MGCQKSHHLTASTEQGPKRTTRWAALSMKRRTSGSRKD